VPLKNDGAEGPVGEGSALSRELIHRKGKLGLKNH
jgi:hypothetical protein